MGSLGVSETGEHNINASSVREYAYEEDRNLRFRPQMEDSKQELFINSFSVHCIVDKIGGDPNCGLFAIFDGHGGK